MTVKELKDSLDDDDDDAHIVVAVVPDSQLVINREGRKMEIESIWRDAHGVLNIIAATQACEVDSNLRAENDL